jgi:hypothetical protein
MAGSIQIWQRVKRAAPCDEQGDEELKEVFVE